MLATLSIAFLVSSLNYGCEQRAAGAIREYEQHKREAFVDKACQIHNMFLSLEEKIETIRPLKIKMDLGEPKSTVFTGISSRGGHG
ncbi:Uncharacterised protein [Providencia rustigianii]|nr:Uncharacterised protein [Providencia rustigianii]